MKKREIIEKLNNSPLRVSIVVPTITAFALILLTVIVLLVLTIAGVRISDTAFIIVSVVVMAVIIAVLIAFVRLYRTLSQLDDIITRISRERHRNDDDAEKMQGAVSRVNMASQDIEQLFENYVIAVNKSYAGELLARKTQFSVLQNQIHPHFLYNTLESIRGQALCSGMTEIADMTEALSHFFRYNISQRGDFVTVSQELDNIHDYFKIQKYRFGDKINLVVQTEDVPIDKLYMPKLTLQPIVENSIIHGFEEKIDPGTIIIRLVLTEKNVRIVVKDDGIGMSSATLRNLCIRLNAEEDLNEMLEENGKPSGSKSLALKNVNQRIKMFFGEGYGLYISSIMNAGTAVDIVFPAIYEIPEVETGGVIR